MSADDFFSRWSRSRADAATGPEAPGGGVTPPPSPAPDLPPPTLEDVAALGHDADFTRFVKPGVDETVRRSAMKKLFTDPHFNVMDGLDIYIGDYNTFEPIPAAMLAMLTHAKPLLDPLGHLQQPAMRMLERLEQAAPDPETSPAADVRADALSPDTNMAGEENPVPAADVQQIDNPAVNAPGTEDGPAADPATATPGDTAVAIRKDPVSPEDDHTIQSL